MESISIRLPPQFLRAPTPSYRLLSRPHQLTHPEWSLHMTVFLFLRRLWPVPMFSLPLGHSSWFDLLLPFPGSVVSRHGRVSPDLGQPSGLRVPSGGCHPRIIARLRAFHGDGTHSCDSPLGSAPLVFGPGPALAGSPMILPSRLYLLLLTRSRHLYPDLSWLRLHAWRLSSAFQEQLASPPL